MDSYTTVTETSTLIELIKAAKELFIALIIPLLIYWVLKHFGTEIKDFINRLRSAKFGSNEFSTSEEGKQKLPDEVVQVKQEFDSTKGNTEVVVNEAIAPTHVKPIVKADDESDSSGFVLGDNPFSMQFWNNINVDFNKKTVDYFMEVVRAEFKPDFKIGTYGEPLFNYLVFTRLTKAFEVVYGEIYYVQFLMLSVIGYKQSIHGNELLNLYQYSRERFNQKRYDRYIGFLINYKLVELDEKFELYKTTELGSDFLVYCVKSGKDWSFKLDKAFEAFSYASMDYQNVLVGDIENCKIYLRRLADS